MGHGRDVCELCSGPSTRRRPRPIEGTCGTCDGRVCRRHLEWDDGWICSRCKRRRAKGRQPQEQAQQREQPLEHGQEASR